MSDSALRRMVTSVVGVIPADVKERFEERAAIREFEGGFPREEAERLALKDCGLVQSAAPEEVEAAS